MPQLGIPRVTAEGGTRFQVQARVVEPDGTIVADASPVAMEPAVVRGDAGMRLAVAQRFVAQFVANRVLCNAAEGARL